jgi:hypothetical protein
MYFVFLRLARPFDSEDQELIGKHISFSRPFISFLSRP